jgi:hypothetical protein
VHPLDSGAKSLYLGLMGTKELRGRATWQDYSGANAGVAEKSFYEVFLQEFKGTDFVIRPKPQEFKDIYVKVELSKEELAAIHTPKIEIIKHGIAPDYSISNTKTKKTLYVEVKRQDGWVEGKLRSAGRGNAHERSNKFFTPGLLKLLRQHGRLGDNVLPFWTVFQGDITRDPCRVREIKFWYDGCSAHYFMWRDSTDGKALVAHFNQKLKHLLL